MHKIQGPLSNAELQIIHFIGAGLCDKEIARAADLPLDTVKQRLGRAQRRNGLKGRTQLALWAIANGYAFNAFEDAA